MAGFPNERNEVPKALLVPGPDADAALANGRRVVRGEAPSVLPRQLARVLPWVACALLALGAVLVLAGEWGPGIGPAALGARLTGAAGCLLFGAGMLAVVPLVVGSALARWRAAPPTRRRERGGAAGQLVGAVALAVFVVVMGTIAGTGAVLQGAGAAADAVAGPVTAEARFDSVQADRPTGRFRALRQARVDLVFVVDGEGPLALSMTEDEAEDILVRLRAVGAADGAVLLTWYPRAGVLAAVEPRA